VPIDRFHLVRGFDPSKTPKRAKTGPSAMSMHAFSKVYTQHTVCACEENNSIRSNLCAPETLSIIDLQTKKEQDFV
jgi:hypothetical protein